LGKKTQSHHLQKGMLGLLAKTHPQKNTQEKKETKKKPRKRASAYLGILEPKFLEGPSPKKESLEGSQDPTPPSTSSWGAEEGIGLLHAPETHILMKNSVTAVKIIHRQTEKLALVATPQVVCSQGLLANPLLHQKKKKKKNPQANSESGKTALNGTVTLRSPKKENKRLKGRLKTQQVLGQCPGGLGERKACADFGDCQDNLQRDVKKEGVRKAESRHEKKSGGGPFMEKEWLAGPAAKRALKRLR